MSGTWSTSRGQGSGTVKQRGVACSSPDDARVHPPFGGYEAGRVQREIAVCVDDRQRRVTPWRQEVWAEIGRERKRDSFSTGDVSDAVRLFDEWAGAVPERLRHHEVWTGAIVVELEEAGRAAAIPAR